MTINVTLTDLTDLNNQPSAVTAINNNSSAIENGFDSALNTAGDTMNGTLNMNGNRITNLPGPGGLNDPIRLGDAPSLFNVPTGSGGTISGLTSNQIPLASTATTITSSVGLGDAQILIGQTSAAPLAKTVSGDATLTDTGALTVTKTNGTVFGTFATQNAATPPAIGGTTPAAGTFTTLTSTVSNVTTGPLTVGTIGSHAGSIVLDGSTSGSLTLQPSNTATPSGTVSIPAATTTLLSTAGQAKTVTPANPTGTASTSGVMMGLGSTATITPTYSSRVYAVMNGYVANSATGNASSIILRQGSGTAPSNGAALGGSAIGNPVVSSAPGISYDVPFSVAGLITGLTPGTAYWFDLELIASAGTSTMSSITCTLFEI